jgi:demethylmenaquinone methyltransferase/2-methoxy-6-polyprenyl-1,4-benzoquinol methylase
LCLLEITRPQSRFGEMILKAYMRGLVPLLARVFVRGADTPALWRYYWDTIEHCVPPSTVIAALERAGFVNVSRHTELLIFSEYRAEKPAT